jgi:hypothetical protein
VFVLPALAPAADQSHHAEVRPRYEDVAQNGCLRVEATQFCMGEAVWRPSLGPHAAMRIMRDSGIVPILRRFVVSAGDAPISVHQPLAVHGAWGFAAAEGRFVLEMRVDVSGLRGDSFGRPVDRAGERAEVAQIYGEHVLTRLFAPPGERRVSELPEGLGIGAERKWVDDDALLAIDGDVDDACRERIVLFGLAHTDSNQHVNSLVYPRLFEELAIEAWNDGELLLRDLHIAWRKPCFAGERVRFAVRKATSGERRGVIGTVSGDDGRTRCTAQLWLR